MFEAEVDYVLIHSLLIEFRAFPKDYIKTGLYSLFHAFFLGDTEVIEGFFHSGGVEIEVDFLQLLVIADLFNIITLGIQQGLGFLLCQGT